MSRPGFGHQMRQVQRQEMLLLPRMLQSIEVLQLPAAELDLYLERAAEGNEALELRTLAEQQRGERVRERRGTREDSDKHALMLANQPSREPGLVDRLQDQLALVEVPADLRPWVDWVIGSLDADGLLRGDDRELLDMARACGLVGGEAELGSAIAIVQQLEPRGVGARSSVEALLLQLDPSDPDYALLARLIEDFLEELAKNKLPAVARRLGIELDELERLFGRVQSLEPHPADAASESVAPVIVPEVVVAEGPDGFEVALEGRGAVSVAIDPAVEKLARDKRVDRTVRRTLREKLDRARWLVDAIHQRRETLLETARAVFTRQRAFLERGPGHLAPLRMGDLAAELGVHVSTVSRAVAGKHVQTPWGIFPLRYFFQSSAGADPAAARDDVREAVRKLFADEDPRAPLSDEDAVVALARRGDELARRTVTKYRKELRIPSSYRRKRHV